MDIQNTPLQKIHVAADRMRKIQLERIPALAENIREFGLHTPILLAPVPDWPDDEFQLVAGHHRLEAVRSLGHETIAAIVLDLDDTQRRLCELDENLCRVDLNAAERCDHALERKRLYLILHPETKHGGKRGSGDQMANFATCSAPSFVENTAEKTGRSERSIREDIRIAENIAPEVMAEIKSLPAIADSGVGLAALASLPQQEQMPAVEAIKTGEASSIREVAAKKPKMKTEKAIKGEQLQVQRRWERQKAKDEERARERIAWFKSHCLDDGLFMAAMEAAIEQTNEIAPDERQTIRKLMDDLKERFDSVPYAPVYDDDPTPESGDPDPQQDMVAGGADQ
ncbi:MAG: ParB N-terminal domain-containing protein [Magnetococcales bacterium]|nr:ParB N-terminal domain-containing protein [Magnetococcales bacterium]